MSGAAKKEAQKKDLSYHYWHGKGGGDAPLATPQKLTPDELAALSLQPKPAGVAASAWNAARRGWHWRCLRPALAPALRKSAAPAERLRLRLLLCRRRARGRSGTGPPGRRRA
jgi:hypothetical protein